MRPLILVIVPIQFNNTMNANNRLNTLLYYQLSLKEKEVNELL